jgi:hypothetical protein
VPVGSLSWQSLQASALPKPNSPPSRRAICATPLLVDRCMSCGNFRLLFSRGLASSETRCSTGDCRSTGQHRRLELRVRGLEVAALASLVSGSLPVEVAMAIAAEALRGRGHLGAASCSVWQSTQRPAGMPNVSLKASSTLPQCVRSGCERAMRNGSAWCGWWHGRTAQLSSRTASNALTWQAWQLSSRPACDSDSLPLDQVESG